jgi:hypothetical protein
VDREFLLLLEPLGFILAEAASGPACLGMLTISGPI